MPEPGYGLLAQGADSQKQSSGGSFLELRPSGHLLARSRKHEKASATGNFPALSPGAEDSPSSLIENEHHPRNLSPQRAVRQTNYDTNNNPNTGGGAGGTTSSARPQQQTPSAKT